jgi:predicted HTH domain antitoxin
MIVLNDRLLEEMKIPEEQIKLEFPIWLYQTDKVSLRKAAKIAGLDWLSFSEILCQRNISTVKMSDEELRTEVKMVNSLIQ